MEALTFQQMLEQLPQPQVIERGYIPPNGRFTQGIPPHQLNTKKLREIASKFHKDISEADPLIGNSEAFAAYIGKVGKFGLDAMFGEYTQEKLEESWRATELYHSSGCNFAIFLASWEEGCSNWIKKLDHRRDLPNQLKKRLHNSLEKLRVLRLRYENSWAILQSFDIPIRSSILLALAKYRELTIEEKKVLLKSAVFHGPIDNPPSDSRVDWYDENGR